MTTTTKTADFMGRALVTPDTDARDYVNRPTIAGDRDYMGRSLTDAEGGGGDASALLDEAAVRFDFSEYTDIEDMVDVNGGWGPFDTASFVFVDATEFTADGLQMTLADGSSNMTPRLRINGVSGPLTFGPDGFTWLLVELIPDGRLVDEEVSCGTELACDSSNNFAPSFVMQWTLSATPEEPDPDFSHDEYIFRIQEGDPNFAFLVDQAPEPAEISPLTATGPIVMCAVCDVATEESRLTLISSESTFEEIFPFGVSPPTFVAAPMQADFAALGVNTTASEITYVELLGWNRALTAGEVDALVAHFTA